MNKNKAKCDFLKSVRKRVADRLGVDLHQVECTFQGTCTGTCPKCKQEEEILNRELLKRVAGVGVGALATLSLAGCAPLDSIDNQLYMKLNSTSDLSDIQGMFPTRKEVDDTISGDVETSILDETTDSEVEIEVEISEDTDNNACDIPEAPEITAGELPYIEEDTTYTEEDTEEDSHIVSPLAAGVLQKEAPDIEDTTQESE